MPLRVAYFVANYHRFAGAQRSLWLLVRALDRSLVEPMVIFPGEGYCTRMFRELGVRTEVIPATGALDRFGGDLLRAGMARRGLVAATEVLPYTARLARFLKTERIDILHCNDARGVLLAGTAGRLTGCRVIWHVRGDARSLGAAYRTACALLSDRIVCVADGVARTIEPRWRNKCVTVYNGIDPVEQPPRRGRSELAAAVGLDIDGGVPLVAAVGSLVPFKGVHHALEALGLMKARVAFVAVGDVSDPAYGAFLEERRAGLADVRFPGWDHEAGDWIRAADIVTLPTVDEETLSIGGEVRRYTNSEGFSRTVLEAMSFGRPVVASAVVGIPEQVVDGETGILVPPSDAPALAAAFERLAADPALRARMGAAGARRVRDRFSIAAMVANTLGVYHSM